MYGFHQAQLLSNMAIGIFTLRQQLRGLLSTNWPGAKTPYVEYLVVGGGGAGGHNYCGGGGGAGGLLTGILPVTSNVSYTVTIGGGGAPTSTNGSNGANSVLSSIIASGGGGGGGDNGGFTATVNGIAGGSGGGGTMLTANLQPTKGAGIAGQGNSSGTASANGFGLGASGGGAGTVGLDSYGSSNPAPVTGGGGAGIASAISGSVVVYAGGGGGGNNNSTVTNIPGGVGGGGAGGANSGTTAGTPGQQYTGGGGGGGGNNSGGGAGGSGIVIVSYPDIYPALTTTSGSPTVSTSGSGSISFNGSSYADYPASASNLSAGDFTLECWLYLNSFTSGYSLFFGIDPNTCYVGPTSATAFKANFGTGGELSWTTSTASLSTWNHYALVRSGSGSNNVTLYLNGVSQGTNTNTATFGGAGSGIVRVGSASGYAINGYISNLRYTKTAVYTGAFTVPTGPLAATQSAGPSGSNIAAITGTSTRLLLNSISPSPYNDSSSAAQTPTITGTSAWNQLSPFATGLGYKNRVYTWTSTGTWAVTV